MNEYILSTDSVCDMPANFYTENNVALIQYSYQIENETFYDDPFDTDKTVALYNKLRAGADCKTSQVNVERYTELFEPFLKDKKDVLHIAFSSGLSGSCQSAKIAAADLAEKYENRVVVVDSLAASVGMGLMVYYAVQKKNENMSLDELATWLETHKFNFVHWFTVEDLFFLKRGGRVSTASAVLGTMLAIKPVLHVDNEGHLIPMAKVRGRAQSLKMMVDKMEETGIDVDNQNIFIGHGDSLDDAKYVESLIKEKYPNAKVMINYIGSTVGAHSGPGTIALFYYGTER